MGLTTRNPAIAETKQSTFGNEMLLLVSGETAAVPNHDAFLL